MIRSSLFAIAFAAAGLTWAVAVAYLGFTSDPAKQFGGLEHLTVFQRVSSTKDRPPRGVLAAPDAPIDASSSQQTTNNQSPPAGRPSTVDMLATASISAPLSAKSGKDFGGDTLAGFTLLSVSGDRALVQAQGVLRSVTQGDSLDTAGAVLTIQRRGGEWFVVTERGYIGSKRR